MNRTSWPRSRRPSRVAHELERHGVDARHAGHLAGRQLGQLAVVPPRQVVLHAADLGLDQMEVVEQPLGGRGEELAAMDVVGQDAIGLAQHPARSRPPAPKNCRPRVVAGSREGEARGEPACALLQPLDAQQLGAERAFSAMRLPGTEEATQGAGHEFASPRSTNNSRTGVEDAHFTLLLHRPDHDAPTSPRVIVTATIARPTPSSRVQIVRASSPQVVERPLVERRRGQAEASR